MTYYKVKDTHDQIKVGNSFLVRRELYTSKQVQKMQLSKTKQDEYFIRVDEKPKNTFYFFGARFSTNHPSTLPGDRYLYQSL